MAACQDRDLFWKALYTMLVEKKNRRAEGIYEQ
jgi:hypothetical protein